MIWIRDILGTLINEVIIVKTHSDKSAKKVETDGEMLLFMTLACHETNVT
jgi:hypothetical protein